MAGISVGLRRGVRTRLVFAAVLLVGALQLASAPPARASEGDSEGFIQTNLVSDLPVSGFPFAKVQDAHLKNPWGIVHGPATPWWVSDNNGNVSTLYDGSGNILPLVVGIPAPDGSLTGAPTGVVFNGNSADFNVTDKITKKTGSSLFI